MSRCQSSRRSLSLIVVIHIRRSESLLVRLLLLVRNLRLLWLALWKMTRTHLTLLWHLLAPINSVTCLSCSCHQRLL